MADDWALLRRYEREADQGAFAELSARHVGMVYQAARRMLGGPGEEAEDVTQAVFLLLAEKAGGMPERGALAGWLYRATRYCCANVRKTEGRRRRREKEAAMREWTSAESEALRQELGPMLDAGLAAISEKERQAILLRYLEQKTVAETGVALGISAEAAEKRVERGLGKLRAFFARRGYAAGSAVLAAALMAEGRASAAPAAVVAKAGSGAPGSAGVMAIAKGAAMGMLWAKVAAAGAITGVAAVVVVAGSMVATYGTVSAPAEAAAASGNVGSGVPRVRAWDLAMTAEGMDRMKQAMTETPSESKGYVVYRGDGEKIRRTIVGAHKDGEVLQEPQAKMVMMDRGGMMGGNGPVNFVQLFTYVRVGKKPVLADSGQLGPVRVTERSAAVRITVKGNLHETSLTPASENGVESPAIKKPAQLSFTGDVSPGQAIVFADDLGNAEGKEIYHVSFWQGYSASDGEERYLAAAGPTRLLETGVDAVMREVHRAMQWNALGVHPPAQVAPAWERKLSNGGILRLAGVSDPGRWRFCWWDPAGEPIATTAEWHAMSGLDAAKLGVVVQAEDTTIAEPTAEEMRRTGQVNGGVGSVKVALVPLDVGEEKEIEVGMGAGPWQDGGEIAMGQTVEAVGVQVKLVEIQASLSKTTQFPGNAWLQFERSEESDVEIKVQALDKAGRDLLAPGTPVLELGREETSSFMHPETELVNAEAAEVKRCVVRWRRREWAKFSGFAREPRVNPDRMPAEGRRVDAAEVSTVAASQPAAQAGAPEVFWEEVKGAIVRQDVNGLRGMMVAKTPEDEQIADGTAEMLISMEALRAAAEKRFGAEQTQKSLGRAGMVMNMKEADEGMKWEVKGETARRVSTRANVVVAGGPGSELVRVGGKWRLNMSLLETMDAEERKRVPEYLKMMAGQSAVRREVAAGIAAGKLGDVDAVMDALREGMGKVGAGR